MAKTKNLIQAVIKKMQNGLEEPFEQVIDGKKRITLQGDFGTLDIEPTASHDKAFAVYGDEADRYCYHVAITAIDTFSEDYNKIGKELSKK